jgi:hypothetical protein
MIQVALRHRIKVRFIGRPNSLGASGPCAPGPISAMPECLAYRIYLRTKAFACER